MDFHNQIVVKSENELENLELQIKTENSTEDWCIRDVERKDAFDQKSDVNCNAISKKLHRCIRCNDFFYYDSLSLFQHNLTHLRVTIEMLPDDILELLGLPATSVAPSARYSNMVIGNIETESLQTIDNNYYSIVKCEVDERYESNMDGFINVDNYKTTEVGNNEFDKHSLDQIDLGNVKKEMEFDVDESNIDRSRSQFIDINQSKISIKFEELEEGLSDTNMDQFIEDMNSNSNKTENEIDLEHLINEEFKSEIKDNCKDLQNPKKKRAKECKNNIVKKKQRKCEICSRLFNWKQYGEHMKQVHPEKKVQCSVCNKEFKCKKNMRTHMKYLHGNMTFHCDNCNSIFSSKDCLQKHIKNVHGTAVRCKICNSRLASEIYLASHMKRVHYDDGKVHSCKVCGKIFKSPRYVRVHVKNSHYVNSEKSVK